MGEKTEIFCVFAKFTHKNYKISSFLSIIFANYTILCFLHSHLPQFPSFAYSCLYHQAH